MSERKIRIIVSRKSAEDSPDLLKQVSDAFQHGDLDIYIGPSKNDAATFTGISGKQDFERNHLLESKIESSASTALDKANSRGNEAAVVRNKETLFKVIKKAIKKILQEGWRIIVLEFFKQLFK